MLEADRKRKRRKIFGENMVYLGVWVSVVALISVIYVMRNEERFSILKKDFSSPLFVGIFTLIVILSIIGLSLKEGKAKNSTRHAVIAFITAYLAHLNMGFAVFFIVWIFVFYTGTDFSV
jgi:hypothetical protein